MENHLRLPACLMRIFLVIFALMISINSQAQKEKLQTAFIYQITQLIEWCPEGKEGNFIIGLLGSENALMSELNALNNRRAGTQRIEVINIADVSAISRTNILIVPDSQFNNIDQISSKVSDFCTLIVSDRVGSASRGAGISIVYDQRQSGLVLEINNRHMRMNSLNVNQRLLNLASNVY